MTLIDLGRRHYALGKLVTGTASRGMLAMPRRIVRSQFDDGRVMALGLHDRTQREMALGHYEPAETELIDRMLGPGDIYVDVGAHVGWFVVRAARKIGARGSVVAFEAFPPNARLFRHNIAINGLSNVTFYHAAVADVVGEADIGVQGGSDSGSATAGSRAAESIARVAQTTLDLTLPAHAFPALIKIDVEGFEERVLDGARGVLERTTAVLIELNEAALRANGASSEGVMTRLNDAGLVHHSTVSHSSRMSNLLASRDVTV